MTRCGIKKYVADGIIKQNQEVGRPSKETRPEL